MNNYVPDPNQLRMDAPATRPNHKIPRHKVGQKFLKGPIPLDWLSLAAIQPGKTLHVAIALWFWVGLRKSCQVGLSMAWLEKTFGMNRYAGYRGLATLERAGLISVVRHQGRKSLVTLLEISAAAPQTNRNEISDRGGLDGSDSF